MDLTFYYEIAASGFLSILVLVNFITRFEDRFIILTSKLNPYFIGRYSLLGPWSRADLIIHAIYITTNICSFSIRVPISKASMQAGTLSVVNMVVVFASHHLSFFADLLGVSINTYQQIHHAAGLVALALLIFHVLVVIAS
jgi:hypothetical protein